jgi:SAM-dependent methyltransferase
MRKISRGGTLERPPRTLLADFLDRAETVGADRETVLRGFEAIRAVDNRRITAESLPEVRRWYASVARGRPDLSVYVDDSFYLGAAWQCWVGQSRKYLLGLRRSGAISSDLRRFVVDLGCGVGYSTLALSDLFPLASVLGTNVDGLQAAVARSLGVDLTTLPGIPPGVDLVFASEYFEHFPAPVDHLLEVVDSLDPRYLVVANSFGVAAIGHFPEYLVDGDVVSPRRTSRAFGAALRRLGYENLKLRFWNGKPAVWRRR